MIYHLVITILLLMFTPLGLYALMIANCLYGLQVCYLNQRMLRKITRYRQEIKRHIYYLLFLLSSWVSL